MDIIKIKEFPVPSNRKIAIIGGEINGLTCARFRKKAIL